jgi:hydroxymethylglutaryl-CoA lyase
MAGTKEVLARLRPPPGSKIHYPVLVPNERGLDDFLAFLHEHPSLAHVQPEISIFTAASDAFSRANTNTDIAGSLARLEPVARRALDKGMRVRGYVSTVDTCPYSGKVEAKVVRDVSRALKDMGCYEISLGDTTGTGTPERIGAMIEEVAKDVPTAMLAGHVSFDPSVYIYIWPLTHSLFSLTVP